MVSGKEIIEAFASAQLEFKVIKYSWTKEFYPSFTDLGFVFSFNGKKYSGRGSDTNEEIALVKAAMEAIERCVCLCQGINTSGVAANVVLESAMTSAKIELIERDAALNHYLTQTKMQRIDVLNSPIKDTTLAFEKQGVEFHFFKMLQTESISPVMPIANGALTSKVWIGTWFRSKKHAN